MAVFAVYAPPGDLTRPELAEKVVFVREGFRLIALVLPFVYFLLHRAWLPLLIYAAGLVLVNVLAGLAGLSTQLVLLVNLLYAILFGIEAAGLRQWSLARKGFEHIASVVARKPEEAEMRFFSSLDARPPRAPSARHATVPGMPRDAGQALLFTDAERPR
jgi:hypothetical protein